MQVKVVKGVLADLLGKKSNLESQGTCIRMVYLVVSRSLSDSTVVLSM